ncbi:MAG TPA: hypothetical protein VFL15_09425 [Gammaproteobacteria bacterium]|nr:hypothetical protein [Gammaproteobacteria bacterium]
MLRLSELIPSFVAAVASGEVELYNEFSLQHELGIFLRGEHPDLKVQFERNVNFFFPDRTQFTKREIDITGFSAINKPAYAIELKYPRNGQYPEQMFSFCKDIAFAEELAAAGFPQTAFLVFAEDHLFYRGPTDGIYGFFRGGKALHGDVRKPTGKKDDEVSIQGHYEIEWKVVSGALKYSVVLIENDSTRRAE